MPPHQTMDAMLGLQELNKLDLYRALGAEYLGTLLLVLFGTASSMVYADTSVISFAFGITLASVVASLGHVSGAHVNPAVTLGFLIARYTSLLRALLYIAAQLLGAISGSALLYSFRPSNYTGNLGTVTHNADMTDAQAFGMELMLSFTLVLLVMAVCDENRKDVSGSAPIAIGLVAAGLHLAAIPLSGCGLNPARCLSPPIIMGGDSWDYQWVYWAGPMLGGALASVVYTFLFSEQRDPLRDRP